MTFQYFITFQAVLNPFYDFSPFHSVLLLCSSFISIKRQSGVDIEPKTNDRSPPPKNAKPKKKRRQNSKTQIGKENRNCH